MHKTVIVLFALLMVVSVARAQPAPTTAPAVDLTSGWSTLQEGDAQGTAEPDAKHPNSTDPHLLHIAVTKTAEPGHGRAGAINAHTFAVQQDGWIDIHFRSSTDRGSVGLVFSLEDAQGKVLARTTLPELGTRGRRGGNTSPTIVWNHYSVSLHVRASDENAHLTITPIEPTSIWLDELVLSRRQK